MVKEIDTLLHILAKEGEWRALRDTARAYLDAIPAQVKPIRTVEGVCFGRNQRDPVAREKELESMGWTFRKNLAWMCMHDDHYERYADWCYALGEDRING